MKRDAGMEVKKSLKKSLKITCKREIKKLIFALASDEKRHTKRLKNTQVFRRYRKRKDNGFSGFKKVH